MYQNLPTELSPMLRMQGIKRVVCGVSGGVDSCIAASTLKRKGFDVIGVFMRNWDVKDETTNCQADQDCKDAESICSRLEIPFFETGFVKEYWNDVFTPLVQDYQKGYTPNPDILCNRHIKFKSFLDYAREKHNADAIATGHYAKSSLGSFHEAPLAQPNNLRRGIAEIVNLDAASSSRKRALGVEISAGASGTLARKLKLPISQEALLHTMFPIGRMLKKQVRHLARNTGFDDIEKRRESTGICFIGRRNFQDFIKDYIKPKPGRFIDVDTGRVVGRHEGIQFYTLGQRSLISGASGAYFVAHKDPKTDDIYVAMGHNNPALYSRTCSVADMHWISGTEPNEAKLQCEFRFQHTHPLVPCVLDLSSGAKNFIVSLSCPQFALTPGQYAVFYNGKECLGSGRISTTEIADHFDEATGDLHAFAQPRPTALSA